MDQINFIGSSEKINACEKKYHFCYTGSIYKLRNEKNGGDMSLATTFVPLSFMTSKDEILHQIKNSILFSYLFENFEETTLSYYLESTQYGYTASALETGNHRFVRITDIKNGTVDWSSVPFCNCDSEAKYLLDDGDILIARTGGTTGKSFIVQTAPKNAVFATYLIRLRLKKKVNQEFISRFLNSYTFWSQIIEMKSGSAMPNVNAEKLKTLVIPKVSYENQDAILKSFFEKEKKNELSGKIKKTELFFNTSNENNEELSKQLDLVKQLRQAFLREAMQGKLVPQDPNDEPASELLKKIKAEKEKLIKEGKLKKQKPIPPITTKEIPFEIPKNWVWCRLGEITDAESPLTYGIVKMGDEPQSDGIPALRCSDVRYRKIDLTGVRRVKESISNQYSRTILQGNEIVLNVRGTLGGCALVTKEFIGFNIAREISLIVLQEKKLNDYVFNVLSSPFFTDEVNKNLRGIAYKGLNLNLLNNFLVPVPPILEQLRIVTKLNELLHYCDIIESNINDNQTQNMQLLQQILREALEPR
ncbi:MAG: hypothetical protein GW823_04920 [Bacteroidetes bacterium]|nr:hypothetical protein [Bacteroidota bacterium]